MADGNMTEKVIIGYRVSAVIIGASTLCSLGYMSVDVVAQVLKLGKGLELAKVNEKKDM